MMMKKLFFLLPLMTALVLLTGCKKSQTMQVKVNAGQAELGFTTNMHDFGTIKEHEAKVHVFELYNVGSEPLVINKVEPSCNCLTVEYTHEPIKPGKSGKLKMVLRSQATGGRHLAKSAVVYSNAKNSPVPFFVKADNVAPQLKLPR